MKFFLCQLLPPRPTFPQDITVSEHEAMTRHAVYWGHLASKGHVVVFGPVNDASGMWGVVVLKAESEKDAEVLVLNDPVMKADIGFDYKVLEMPTAVLGKDVLSDPKQPSKS